MGTVQELCNLTDVQASSLETAHQLAERWLLGKDAAHVLEEEMATTDALIEGLLAVGATFEEIGKTIAALTLPTV